MNDEIKRQIEIIDEGLQGEWIRKDVDGNVVQSIKFISHPNNETLGKVLIVRFPENVQERILEYDIEYISDSIATLNIISKLEGRIMVSDPLSIHYLNSWEGFLFLNDKDGKAYNFVRKEPRQIPS